VEVLGGKPLIKGSDKKRKGIEKNLFITEVGGVVRVAQRESGPD